MSRKAGRNIYVYSCAATQGEEGAVTSEKLRKIEIAPAGGTSETYSESCDKVPTARVISVGKDRSN